MVEPLVVTHTDIVKFLRCRRSWYWGFVRDYNKPDKKTGPLALGSRVHSSLEALYRGLMAGEAVDALAVHQALGAADIDALEMADAPVWEMNDLYDDIIVGRNCIAGYVQWLEDEGANHGFLVDGVEEYLEVPILDGFVLLRCKLDLRLRSEFDGSLSLIDFKTSGYALNAIKDELERSYQLRLYRVIQQLVTPEAPVNRLAYDLIKKVTKRQKGVVQVERYPVPGVLSAEDANRKHIEGIALEMLRLIEELGPDELGPHADLDVIMYPTPGTGCRYCEYRHPCTLADEAGYEAADGYLDANFPKGKHDRYGDEFDLIEPII